MDREMRRQYTVLVDFLGHILGPDYEVCLLYTSPSPRDA